MHVKNLLIGAIALVALIAGTSANATDFVYDGGGTGAWTDANAWDLNSGYPNHVNDKATIGNFTVPGLSSVTITVGELVLNHASARVSVGSSAFLKIDRGTSGQTKPGTMSLVASAQIDIQAGGTLEILNNNANQAIGGQIVLSSSTSVLKISQSAVLGPNGSDFGSVLGQHGSAKIQIIEPASGDTSLTNQITIVGMMKIEPVAGDGTSTFWNDRASTSVNSGVVQANAAGTLEFAPGLQVDDLTHVEKELTYVPLWASTTNAAAKVWFRNAAGTLAGNFVVSNCADMEFDAAVVTGGALLAHSGTLDASGGSFTAVNYGPSSSSVTSGDCD